MSIAAKPRKSKTKTTTRRVSMAKRKAKLHVVSPASAEEIRQSLGITKRDMAVARSVMLELGYTEAAATLRK